MVHRLILMSKEGLIATLAKSCKRRFLTLYARMRAVGDIGVPSTDQHANAESEHPWRTSRNAHNMPRVEPSGSGTYRDRGGQSTPNPPSFVRAPGPLAMSLSLLKFVGQASLVDYAMLPS